MFHFLQCYRLSQALEDSQPIVNRLSPGGLTKKSRVGECISKVGHLSIFNNATIYRRPKQINIIVRTGLNT